MPLDDLSGLKFGLWTVQNLHPKSDAKRKYWQCLCECGTERAVIAYSLRHAESTNCGCVGARETSERFTQHGMYKHPAYHSWRQMRHRCNLPTATGYDDYGGRGIRICEEWNDFAAFWTDMGPTWAPGLTLDRIETNGHYEPRNCRWATALQQANNRRNNNVIPTPLGPMTVSDAAREFGVNRNTIFRRIRDGWDRHKLLQPAQFSPRWHVSKE